jgi:hypothetical protein
MPPRHASDNNNNRRYSPAKYHRKLPRAPPGRRGGQRPQASERLCGRNGLLLRSPLATRHVAAIASTALVRPRSSQREQTVCTRTLTAQAYSALRTSAMKTSRRQVKSASGSGLRPGPSGSRLASALPWNMGAFLRNPTALVLRDETNDLLA